VIVQRVTGEPVHVTPVATTQQLAAIQRECRSCYVDPNLIQYAVRLVAATRNPDRFGLKDFGKYLTYGASPRATIGMIEGARALAYLRGRNYALPEDVTDLVHEALADGKTPDMLIQTIMAHVAAPDKPLEAHVRVANG
jgi:MoxR-like ATPase